MRDCVLLFVLVMADKCNHPNCYMHNEPYLSSNPLALIFMGGVCKGVCMGVCSGVLHPRMGVPRTGVPVDDPLLYDGVPLSLAKELPCDGDPQCIGVPQETHVDLIPAVTTRSGCMAVTAFTPGLAQGYIQICCETSGGGVNKGDDNLPPFFESTALYRRTTHHAC